MSVSLAHLCRDLASAQREVPRVERVLLELRKTSDRASATLTKARNEHTAAVSAQTTASASYADEPTDDHGRKVERTDKRVRLARLALDGTEGKARAAASAVTECEAARTRSSREVDRLRLVVAAHHETYGATVDPRGRSALVHLRGLLADLDAIRSAREAVDATARAHADAGFGPLAPPDGALDLAEFLLGALEGGKPIVEEVFKALRHAAMRRTYTGNGRSLLETPRELVGLLTGVLIDPTREAGVNRGYLNGAALGVLSRLRAGEAWRDAAVAVGLEQPVRPSGPGPSTVETTGHVPSLSAIMATQGSRRA